MIFLIQEIKLNDKQFRDETMHRAISRGQESLQVWGRGGSWSLKNNAIKLVSNALTISTSGVKLL